MNKKIFVASFHRASDGALEHLIERMKEENLYTDDYKNADYILAVGDREETYDFVLQRYKEGKRIIHLWAGEIADWECDNDMYRHSLTLMSSIQLCQHDIAKERVKKLCISVNKRYFVSTIGNLMVDNLKIDESKVPDYDYDLVLYNPPNKASREQIKKELKSLSKYIIPSYIWLPPNGDRGSDLVEPYVNMPNQPRPIYLGLLKNCLRFVTNSTSQHHEAPFLIDKDKIKQWGVRNLKRECLKADMSKPGATERVIKIFKSL